MPAYPFSEIRDRLDDWRVFNNMVDSPYYHDAVYEKFSDAEYQRRYQALRTKMRTRGLDCAIVPGGPNHWSFGGGMLWLSGHWEWHAMANYVVFPLEGEPTLIYSMGGTHIEATRRVSAIKDVRQSRGGRFAEVIVERLKELGLERGKIGLLEIDPRFHDYLPVNQYNALKEALPNVSFSFESGFMHELVYKKSAEELQCIRKAGKLCEAAMQALAARCKAGVTEYQLKAAAAICHPRRRRRCRFRDHRLDADEKSLDDLRQSASVGTRAQRGRHRDHGACRRLPRLQRANRLTDLPRRAAERRCAAFSTTSYCPASSVWSLRRGRAIILRKCVQPVGCTVTRACNRGRSTFTASTSSAPSRISSPTTSKPKSTSRCSNPAWCW